MSLKSFLLKRLIVWDSIPCRLRWRKFVNGIGTIYSHTLEMMHERYGINGINNLNEVMYTIGLRQSTAIIEQLGLKRDLEGCAYVLMAMHQIFGIKSKIAQKDTDKIIIHAGNVVGADIWKNGMQKPVYQ